METLYIETTIVSYLVANPNRDPLVAAHQTVTREWWERERQRHQCVTSQEVWREALLGDGSLWTTPGCRVRTPGPQEDRFASV